MTAREWPDEFLDGLRLVGDPEGDAVVESFFADVTHNDPGQLFRSLVTRQTEDNDTVVADYLGQAFDLPDWVDPDTLAAGQECFAHWGSHVFTALYAAALPSAYASWRGVQVLGLTARLETDATRRLNETAQFHLSVMTPGGLDADGSGTSDARHVRLMHAAVRWLIAHDDRAPWDPDWGLPINQEDLLETLLTFTEIVFEVFDRTGVVYTEEEADAYLHVWSIVGYLIGVRGDLLPLRRQDTAALMPEVRRRQFGASEAGRVLTEALLEQAGGMTPPGFKGLPATTLRYYVGDEVADLLGVPPADWTKALFKPLSEMTRRMSAHKAHSKMLSGMSERVGMRMLRAAIDAKRSGDRASFTIPTELAARWKVSPTGVRQGVVRRRAR